MGERNEKAKPFKKSGRLTAEEAGCKKDLEFEQVVSSSERGSHWIMMAVSALVLIVVATVFLLPVRNGERPDRAKNPTEPDSWEGLLPREVITKFKNASTVEEKLAHLNYPELVRERAARFFSTGAGSREEISEISIQKSAQNSQANLRYLVRLGDGGTRTIVLSVDPAGPRIDFDFYARWCEIPWPEFFTGPVSTST